MKVNICIAMLVVAVSLSSFPTYADEPCKVTLCLWGKMKGQFDSKCDAPERKFFKIVRKKKGSFLPGHTFDAREDFIKKECPEPYGANEFIDKIMKKYGKVRA